MQIGTGVYDVHQNSRRTSIFVVLTIPLLDPHKHYSRRMRKGIGLHANIRLVAEWNSMCSRFDERRQRFRDAKRRKGEISKWTNAHILPATARLHREKNTAVPIATMPAI
jgi:hypothetical protein